MSVGVEIVYRRLVFVRHLETWSEKQVLHSSFRGKCRIYWRGGLVNSHLFTYIHFVSLFRCVSLFYCYLSVKLVATVEVIRIILCNKQSLFKKIAWFRLKFYTFVSLFRTIQNTFESIDGINGQASYYQQISNTKCRMICIRSKVTAF